MFSWRENPQRSLLDLKGSEMLCWKDGVMELPKEVRSFQPGEVKADAGGAKVKHHRSTGMVPRKHTAKSLITETKGCFPVSEATGRWILMFPGKMNHHDSASHLALNLEMTQKERGLAGEKEWPPTIVWKITGTHEAWGPG